MKESKSTIHSYVFHGEKCWYVSTIYRQCSALYNNDMYYETLVWEYDVLKKERGKIVHQSEELEEHFNICKSILEKGAFWENEGI